MELIILAAIIYLIVTGIKNRKAKKPNGSKSKTASGSHTNSSTGSRSNSSTGSRTSSSGTGSRTSSSSAGTSSKPPAPPEINESEKVIMNAFGEEDIFVKSYANAKMGNPQAATYMGAVYCMKLNNPDKALAWFRIADAGNDPDGTFWLGKCYIEGIGIRKNAPLGTTKVTNAAKDGSTAAIRYLREVCGKSDVELKEQGIPI